MPKSSQIPAAGLFIRLCALLTDVSVGTWLATQSLHGIARRFREEIANLLGVSAYAVAIDSGASSPEELLDTIQATLLAVRTELVETCMAFGLASLTMVAGVFLTYFTVFEAGPFGSTPGKACFGIQVVNTAYVRIGIIRSLLRQLAKCVTLCTLGLGYFLIPFTKQRVSLHDWFAGTLAVRRMSTIARIYRYGACIVWLYCSGVAAYIAYERIIVSWRWLQILRVALPLF